jgi:hypothetical protein
MCEKLLKSLKNGVFIQAAFMSFAEHKCSAKRQQIAASIFKNSKKPKKTRDARL